MYKPLYKVAHKTITELEWRCCPGFSGYDCMEGHPVYQHPMKMMPPFQGPPMKGPQFKGPPNNAPVFKGSPMNTAVKANPWSHPKRPPTGSFNPHPMHHFGSPRSSSYPDTPFQPYPSEPESAPEHQEPHYTESNHEHENSQAPEEFIPEEIPPPPPHPSSTEEPVEETAGMFPHSPIILTGFQR